MSQAEEEESPLPAHEEAEILAALEAVRHDLHRADSTDPFQRLILPSAILTCMCMWAIADVLQVRASLTSAA